jgi:hypothetical protein
MIVSTIIHHALKAALREHDYSHFHVHELSVRVAIDFYFLGERGKVECDRFTFAYGDTTTQLIDDLNAITIAHNTKMLL